MGFSDLGTNERGILHLSIAHVGELFIDIQQPHIFLYLLNQFSTINFELISTAYLFCEEKAKYAFITNPVMRDGDILGFAIKVKEENFTPIVLENAINQLIDMAARLKQFADNFQ
jgi:hypothetical protein